MSDFVPTDFSIPDPPAHDAFVLEPLGPQHNAQDYAAWQSSIDHIAATPGYADHGWPTHDPFPAERNLEDLVQHAADFAARTGFTYTVLDPTGADTIGCVYIYPREADDPEDADANIRSWVRASHADLDPVLHGYVTDWLASDWPFANPAYAARA